MSFGSATPHRTRGRRTNVILAQIAAVVSAPLILFAYSSNPPAGLTGAPGEGTCASCHGSLTAGSGVTVAFPSTTYTPGGPAVSWTVNVPTGPGGFELSARAQSDNSQAGSLTAGASSAVATSGSIQYVRQSSTSSSWTIQWTPPAASVGNVAVYVVGVGSSFGTTFSNSYVLSPVATTPGTLAVSPTSLTFTANAAAPPTQAVQVTSAGSPIAVTTSVSTATGGNWLTATPPGGSTPVAVTVGVNPAGLAVGTYMGSVAIASTNATNSPQTVSVTLNVTAAEPPSLVLSPTSLSFSSTVGGTAPARNVQVTGGPSPLSFTAAASTTTGGNWLAVSPASGATPATEAVSVNSSGLAAGTYQGAVTFTSAGAANSPVTLGVTLTVAPQAPPPTTAVRFSFSVRDRQSGGADSMLIDGSGSVDASGHVTGSGHFTRYRSSSGEDGSPATIASGTWQATGVTSFTPAASGGREGSRTGGILVLQVRLSTQGGPSSTAEMRIANTGSDSGVTLTIDGGATFTPSGTGRVSITAGGASRGGEGSGDDGGSSGSDR